MIRNILAVAIFCSFCLSGPIAHAKKNADPDAGGGPEFHTLTYDLGISFGTYNKKSYTEVDLGLNYFFLQWLAWRNAVFYRGIENGDNFSGLDSSARAIYDSPSSNLGFTTFGGVGYRFANHDANAPFLEAGLSLKLAGIRIGGGVKSVLYSMKNSNSDNDNSFFLILGGGGAL